MWNSTHCTWLGKNWSSKNYHSYIVLFLSLCLGILWKIYECFKTEMRESVTTTFWGHVKQWSMWTCLLLWVIYQIFPVEPSVVATHLHLRSQMWIAVGIVLNNNVCGITKTRIWTWKILWLGTRNVVNTVTQQVISIESLLLILDNMIVFYCLKSCFWQDVKLQERCCMFAKRC